MVSLNVAGLSEAPWGKVCQVFIRALSVCGQVSGQPERLPTNFLRL